MSKVAKLFIKGRSQAVRLPAAYRFNTKEVFIRRDPSTGDVILSRRPDTCDGFFAALQGFGVSGTGYAIPNLGLHMARAYTLIYACT